MERLSLLAFLLHTIAGSAQWELMTPIKTRSEFTALHMVNDAAGFAVDFPMGAILRTRDGGYHWERMVNSLSNNPIGMHVWDAERAIVVGESGSVYRTTDAFTTVTGTNNPVYGTFQSVHFVNDTLGWAGTQTGRIYRSTDGGATWTLMQSGLSSGTAVLRIQFLDVEVGYASCSGSNRVIKSTDGGLTWQDSSPPYVGSYRGMHWYDALTGVCTGSPGFVARTTDGGASWDSIPSNSTYVMNDLAAQGDVMLACGWWGRTIRSTDAGLSWTEVQTGSAEHRSVSLLPSGEGVMGTDGRILGTNDMGLSWSVRNMGTFHTRLNKVSFMNADTGVAVGWQTTGGFENGLIRTTDGGRTWLNAGGGGLGVHMSANGQGCLGGGSGSFSKTFDGFDTRTNGTGPNVAIRCTWTFDANTMIVAGGAVFGGIYRTANAGASWTHVLDVGNITISDLWFVDDQQGYAVGEYGDNYRTMDGGVSWQPLQPTSGSHTVFFLNEQLGWTKQHRTTDGGDTWITMGGTPQTTMSVFFTDPDTGYAVGYSGQTVRSIDGGENWENFLPEILNANVGDAMYVDGHIIIVCNNGDIFRGQAGCSSIPTVPFVAQDGTTLCTTLAGEAQWYVDQEPIDGATASCITVDQSGSYTVIVEDVFGCTSAASEAVQVVVTGIFPTADDRTVVLHPNPASTMTWLDRKIDGTAQVVLIDAQGRFVLERRITGKHAAIDLSGLETGMYLMRVSDANGTSTMRVLKQ
ncbi:MAG: T9SS type A sorting domain-containing protein [Flavobacteriales bacterium]